MARVRPWLIGVCALVFSCHGAGCGYKTSPRPASASIPGEIRLVHAHAYPDRIVLMWDVPASNTDGSPLEDVSGFKVYRASKPIGEECEDCERDKEFHANVDYETPTNAVIKDGEVRYSDKRVEPGRIYWYSVSVYNLKGREGPSSRTVSVVFEQPPPAPSGPSVRREAEGLMVTWTPPSRPAGINGYRVYRGTRPNRMEPVGRTKWAETYFLDKDVKEGETYYYLVRSVKMKRGISQESPPSETVKAVYHEIDWKPPENIGAEAVRGGVRVQWSPVDIEGRKTAYNVYRSESGTLMRRINISPVRRKWYVDRTVRPGREYRYAVTAFPLSRPEFESARSASGTIQYKR